MNEARIENHVGKSKGPVMMLYTSLFTVYTQIIKNE